MARLEEAFCSKCHKTMDHEIVKETNKRLYLKCCSCGTERTWDKVGIIFSNKEVEIK